jgi:hypothetical protein
VARCGTAESAMDETNELLRSTDPPIKKLDQWMGSS